MKKPRIISSGPESRKPGAEGDNKNLNPISQVVFVGKEGLD
jgi:hypothetical protein